MGDGADELLVTIRGAINEWVEGEEFELVTVAWFVLLCDGGETTGAAGA